MKYKITGKTNGWIAQRDSLFKGKTEITLADNLTLKEAQEKILAFHNEDYDMCCEHWGIARRKNPHNTWTETNGIRGYEYDSRYYRIEIQEDCL